MIKALERQNRFLYNQLRFDDILKTEKNNDKKVSFLKNKSFSLSNNQLKIIAMAAMTADHAAKELFPSSTLLLIFGRLAFPIFAYMIAEGCRYTKNKRRYFLQIFILGTFCQSVYFFAMGSMYQNILITFSLSVVSIFAIERFFKKKDFLSLALVVIALFSVAFLCLFLPSLLKSSDFQIDYGLLGVFLPVVIYFMPSKKTKIIASAAILTALSFELSGLQWFSLAALPLLFLYNGKRGKLKLKYLFYVFYPAHLAIIYLIGELINYFS